MIKIESGYRPHCPYCDYKFMLFAMLDNAKSALKRHILVDHPDKKVGRIRVEK